MDNILQHHGVLGMKWGVRRYQNYDGSYTKKGLERYNKAQSNYDSAKASLKKTKSDYKSGSASKGDYKMSKTNLKSSKKALDKSYDRLKMDKRADKGKMLYKQGKTITDNEKKRYGIEGAIVVGSAVANRVLNKMANKKIATVTSASLAIGGTFVNAMLDVKINSDNRNLRAYYAH